MRTDEDVRVKIELKHNLRKAHQRGCVSRSVRRDQQGQFGLLSCEKSPALRPRPPDSNFLWNPVWNDI
jgi:hypothetical protein